MTQNVSIVMTNSTKQILISVAICKYVQIRLKEKETIEDAIHNYIDDIGDDWEIENVAITEI